MSIRRLLFLTGLGLYTLFSVVTFLKVAEYSFSALYFIGCTVVWFKIYQYGKRKQQA